MKTIKKALALLCVLLPFMQVYADEPFKFRYISSTNVVRASIYYYNFGTLKKHGKEFNGFVFFNTANKVPEGFMALGSIDDPLGFYIDNPRKKPDDYFFLDAGIIPSTETFQEMRYTTENVKSFLFLYDKERNNCEYVICDYHIPFFNISDNKIRTLLETGRTSIPVGVYGIWHITEKKEKIDYTSTVDATIDRPIPTELKTGFNPEKEELTLTWKYKMPSYEAPYYFVFFRKERSASAWTPITASQIMVQKGNSFKTETVSFKMAPSDYGKDWEYAVTLAFDNQSAKKFNSGMSAREYVSVASTKPKNLRFIFNQPDKLTLNWEYTNSQKFKRNYRIYKVAKDTIQQPIILLENAAYQGGKPTSTVLTLPKEELGKEWTYIIDLVTSDQRTDVLTNDTCSANLIIPHPKTLEAAFDEKNNQLTLDWSYNNSLSFIGKWRIYKKIKDSSDWKFLKEYDTVETGRMLRGNTPLFLSDEEIGQKWTYAVCLESGIGKGSPSDDIFSAYVDIDIVPPYPENMNIAFDPKSKLLDIKWGYNNPHKLPWKWYIHKKEKNNDNWILVNDTVTMLSGMEQEANSIIKIEKRDYNKDWIYAVTVARDGTPSVPSDDKLSQYREVNTEVESNLLIWGGVGLLILAIIFALYWRNKKK